ncbi:hypothetical protein COP2_028251 [Malus domestica]
MLLLASIPRYSFTPAARWKLQSSDPLVQPHSTTQVVPTTGTWPQKENDLAVLPRQRKGHNNNFVGGGGGTSFSSVTIMPFNRWAIVTSVSIERAAERTTELIMWFKGFYGNLS